jgi:hypothetical protein
MLRKGDICKLETRHGLQQLPCRFFNREVSRRFDVWRSRHRLIGRKAMLQNAVIDSWKPVSSADLQSIPGTYDPISRIDWCLSVLVD